MRSPTPRPLLGLFVFIGLGGVLAGLNGAGFQPTCGLPGMWKCLPGVVLAGRALWIAVGAGFAGIGGLALLRGRRPWATAVALVAGAVELGVGGWVAYALATGIIPITGLFELAWPLIVMLASLGGGVNFLAAAVSDRVMDRFGAA